MARIKHIRDVLTKDYIDALPGGSTIKYKDYFHMKLFYEMMHEWLVEEGWCTREDEKFKEVFYLQRESQTSGTELWIWWRLEKDPRDMGSKYYRYQLDIDIHVILMKDVEVVRNNMKFKIHNGEPEIKINARILLDYEHKWRNHWFLKHFHEAYKNRMMKGTISLHRRNLYRETYRLQEAIKTYLKLRTYLPEQEGQQFHINKDFD